MDDQIFKSESGELFCQYDGVSKKLCKNPLGIYAWMLYHAEYSTDNTTTLKDEGFVLVGHAIMKEIPQIRLLNEDSDPLWITGESGGFTRATTNTLLVQQTHTAIDAFNDWVPENAQQRRFKAMVECLEAKAKNEEDEYCFARGTTFDA